MQDWYTENHKTFWKKLEEGIHKWRDIPWWWIKRLSTIKMSILTKEIHRFKVISMITPVALFGRHSESESEITQSCPTFWDTMDHRLPGSSVHGILQARTLEWFALSFSRGSSRPRNRTWVLHTASSFFAIWATLVYSKVYLEIQGIFPSLSLIISQSMLKLTSIGSLMPSNHLILCCPLPCLSLSQHQGLFQRVEFSH